MTFPKGGGIISHIYVKVFFMKKFLNKLPLFIISLLAIMFLCYPKVSAYEEYSVDTITGDLRYFEINIYDPLGKETFLYDDSLPDKEGQISFGKKGYSKEKYNIVLAEAKTIREYIEKPENRRDFSNPSNKIHDFSHPLMFPLAKEFHKHLEELNSSSVTGTRLDVRYYKQEIKKYDFLFQTDTGNPDNNFYDDPITLVQMPGTGEQVIKYYVKKADANLYGEKHNQITSLISSYDNLDFASTELTNSFNNFVLFYNDFINNKRYTGNLVKFKIKKEDTTTEFNAHAGISNNRYIFTFSEFILRTHFATEDEINNGKIIEVNGVERKFIPKVFYYVLAKQHDQDCIAEKKYINLKTTPALYALDSTIVDNTFYVEWVPENPVVTFKVKPLAENFKNHEILYSTKIVNFSSWDGNIPKIPDYQEFAKYFNDMDEMFFLNGYYYDNKYRIKSIGWCYENKNTYDFNVVPTEDLTLYAYYQFELINQTEFSRWYYLKRYYENELISDNNEATLCLEINKDTKIAKQTYNEYYTPDFYTFYDYKDGHNRRYFFEKFIDDEGNEIDLSGFDFNKYEELLRQKKCKLIYNRYEQFYQIEFHCKDIKNYDDSYSANINVKKYFFKGDIIGEDVTREFDKYCQDPHGKMVQKLSYWREKETKERVDLTKPLEERNYVLEPVIEDTTVPFIPIERVVLETNYLSIDPFDTDTYEVKIPYKVYPENATEEFSLAECSFTNDNDYYFNSVLRDLFKNKKILHRLENNKIIFTFSKEIYRYFIERYYYAQYEHRDINFGIRFAIIPNSIFFPTNLSSFGYLELWEKYNEKNYVYLKGINSIYFNFELHSEKLREELKEAKELFESTYFVPNAYQENSLPKGTKIITDELIYNRLFYLIEEADLYLNNIRSTLLNPKFQNFRYNQYYDFGYTQNTILYHLLINLRKTKSEFESSLKTIDVDGTTNNGFEVIYHNHLGKPFRKFKYVYDINLRLPLVNPELGYYVHRDGDSYVARKFMYWALTQQTIGEGSYPKDIFDGKDLFYHYSKSKVIHLYPVYYENFDGFIKINVYDADKNKVFETRVYPKFYAEFAVGDDYSDSLAYQDIISYDKTKEQVRGWKYRYWHANFFSFKYFFSINELNKILRLWQDSLIKPDSGIDFIPANYSKNDENYIIKKLEPYKDPQVTFYNYESKISNNIAVFQFKINYHVIMNKFYEYESFPGEEYVKTWLLHSPHRDMIRGVEFKEVGYQIYYLYITFKRDNLFQNYPDYIDLKFSDIFGKDVNNGRPLRIIIKKDGSIPENPVVYKEKLVILRASFQEIFDTVIFANYLTHDRYNYPKQKFLKMKYKKEIIKSIAELNGLIADTTLNQKTVDQNVFMYMAIYQMILSNILYGSSYSHHENIDQGLLNKMQELLEKVQNLKNSVSSVPLEESTQTEFCLDKNSLDELKKLEQEIIKSIDYFPFLKIDNPYKFISQSFYDETKSKIEDLSKSIRVNDKKVKILFEQMKSFNNSYSVTNSFNKPYLLERGIKYLFVKDHENFISAYNKIDAIIKTIGEINSGAYSFTESLPEIKTVYEASYNTFYTVKRKIVIGTWFHPDITEIFKVKKQLEEIRDKVFTTSKENHYELRYPNYYLTDELYRNLMKDITEIEACLDVARTLFQEDVDKVKNEKAPKITIYNDGIFMGGDELKLIFKGLENLKKEVRVTDKTDPELLPKDQKYLVSDSYRLLEELVSNLEAKIATGKVDMKTIEADVNKHQENLTSLQKQVIVGRRLIDISRLQSLLKRAQNLYARVKIQGDFELDSGDRYLQRTKYHSLENLISDLKKQTEGDFLTNDSFEEYQRSKEEELSNLEKSVEVFQKAKNTALIASLFTFLGIVLIGLIAFPIVIKVRKNRKDKK